MKITTIHLTKDEKDELLKRSKSQSRNGAKSEAEVYVRFCLNSFSKVLTENTALDSDGNILRFNNINQH
jgi:hypothetical protein